jgi:hypothetical protein
MRRGKTIRCRCFGPMAANPNDQCPWDDVWLRWTSKPGRRKVRVGTTLVSRRELQADYRRAECPPDVPPDPEPACVAEWRRVLAALDREHRVVGATADPTYIYTNSAGIDRTEAERMLALFLRERHGIEAPRFRWDRLSRAAVIPLGFG